MNLDEFPYITTPNSDEYVYRIIKYHRKNTDDIIYKLIIMDKKWRMFGSTVYIEPINTYGEKWNKYAERKAEKKAKELLNFFIESFSEQRFPPMSDAFQKEIKGEILKRMQKIDNGFAIKREEWDWYFWI